MGATAEELVEAARALPVRLPDIVIHNVGGVNNNVLNNGGGDGGDSNAPPPPTMHATPVALHHGGAVQVEVSLPIACKRLVSTLEPVK